MVWQIIILEQYRNPQVTIFTIQIFSNAFVFDLQNLVLCFRLHFAKDCTTINTAGATVRQLISLVFERVVAEDRQIAAKDGGKKVTNIEELKVSSNVPPKGLKPCAADAYLMFQVSYMIFSLVLKVLNKICCSRI